jgi:predicted kinase
MTGLPGVGKTTLSKRLAYHLKATYIRIDTIEQSMKDAKIAVTYDESYRIAFNVATDNLLLGLMVVADSTNPVIESREAWWRVATRAKVKYLDIQVICSDKKEHRHRVESRKSDIPSLELPTWQSVIEREYDEWNTPESPSQLLTIDTAGLTEQQTFDNLLAEIRKANIIAHA